MQLNLGRLNILKQIPYLFFIAIFVWMFLDDSSNPNSSYKLLPAIPFLVQLFIQKKFIDLILGLITSLLAIWMFLAYVSDLYKPGQASFEFIFFGAVMVLLLFINSFLLLRNEAIRLS